MPNPRLAARYAKSLLDLSIERNQLEDVYADMQLLKQICAGNKDFVNLLRSPVITSDTKQKIMDTVIASVGQTTDLFKGFTRLLISKARESNLPEIVNAFIEQYKVHNKIHTVKLRVASPISDEVRSAIVAQVKKAGGFEKIELEEKIDPSIIGGFVLQVGDKLVDASIAYDLKAIAKQFENNDFIYKIR